MFGDLNARLEKELAEDSRAPARAAPVAPRTAPGQLIHFSTDYQATVAELDALKKTHAKGFNVPLDKLRASPHQIGELDPDRVQSLKANLRENPLNTPVVVRILPDGFFELVSGHHRAEAFRSLDRTHIPAVASEISDDEARRLVFFDNLLAPNLSDYEKYLGFAALRKSEGLTLAELAAEAGINETTVTRLFTFEKLPAAAQELIRANPKAASYTLFAAMSAFQDKPEAVTQAVALVMEGRLQLKAAPTFVQEFGKERVMPAATVDRVVIKNGNSKYVEMRRREGDVVLRFKDKNEAEAVLIEVEKLLRARLSGEVQKE